MGNKVFKIRGYDEFGQEVFRKDVVGTKEDACDYMYEYAWRSKYPDDNEVGKVERLELIIPQEYEDFTVEEEINQEEIPYIDCDPITELPF